MDTYLILSTYAPEAFKDPSEFPKLADKVEDKVKKDCPGVVWKESYVTMGQFDAVDVVEAPNREEVERAAMIIRGIAKAHTVTVPATPWKTFIQEMGGA